MDKNKLTGRGYHFFEAVNIFRVSSILTVVPVACMLQINVALY